MPAPLFLAVSVASFRYRCPGSQLCCSHHCLRTEYTLACCVRHLALMVQQPFHSDGGTGSISQCQVCECVMSHDVKKSQVEAIRRSLHSFSRVFDLLFCRCLLTVVILILCWSGTIFHSARACLMCAEAFNIVTWRTTRCGSQVYSGSSSSYVAYFF